MVIFVVEDDRRTVSRCHMKLAHDKVRMLTSSAVCAGLTFAVSTAVAEPSATSNGSEPRYSVTEEGDIVPKPLARPAESEPKSAEPGARPEQPEGAGASVAAGAFLPMTQTPVVGPQRSLALVLGGYEGAREQGLVDSRIEANVWGPIAIRASFAYETEGEAIPSAGARVELLTQKKYELDLGVSAFYQPKDFREEGNIVGKLSAGRSFGRLALFASSAFESDPEGDDRIGELGSALLFRLSPQLYSGFELRYRRDLASDDAKRFGHSEPIFDFRAAPTLSYALGPLVMVAETGIVVRQTLNAIGTADERSDTRAGVLALAGLGGAL